MAWRSGFDQSSYFSGDMYRASTDKSKSKWFPPHDHSGVSPNAKHPCSSLPSFGEVITGTTDWRQHWDQSASTPCNTPSGGHNRDAHIAPNLTQNASNNDTSPAVRLQVMLQKKLNAPLIGSPQSPTHFDSPPQQGPPLNITLNLSDRDIHVLGDALTSLYEDQIFPCANTVKARLQQLGCSPAILTHFLELYEIFPAFTVDRKVDPPATFYTHEPKFFNNWVEPTSPDDPYPREMWEAFSVYLQDILAAAGDTMNLSATDWANAPFAFHRGRYGMAQELLNRNLEFFRSVSLGQMCHIVELGIRKKLLAYENNMLVPAAACVSLTNALFGSPTASTTPHSGSMHSEYIADVEELKHSMVRVLTQYPDGFNLSTLKTKMRAVYHKRLSETVFHQTKLLDLVQQYPLNEVCVIEKMVGNCGYFVHPTPALLAQIQRDLEHGIHHHHSAHHSGYHQYHTRGSSYGSERGSSGTNPSPSHRRQLPQQQQQPQARNSSNSSKDQPSMLLDYDRDFPVLLDDRALLLASVAPPPGFGPEAAKPSNIETTYQPQNSDTFIDEYSPMKVAVDLGQMQCESKKFHSV
eukprot:GEMP01010527.1.p1 GENE.GEMP01010527.1~~GEMP01010527.1.p1  ORF type:complete len:579 (+),score=150.17 GEMP01010527.1:125-1861(+)